MFQYFIQVVPTKVDTYQADVDTFQYAVTEKVPNIALWSFASNFHLAIFFFEDSVNCMGYLSRCVVHFQPSREKMPLMGSLAFSV